MMKLSSELNIFTMNENELIKKSKQIEELQNTIINLNNKLKESESLKSNFISNIMNEVYNPFSSIISMADNILSLKDSNLQQAIPMAEIIYNEAAKLDFHLQNIFTAATIEAGLEAPEITSINLHSLFDDIIKKFQFDISSKELNIESNLLDLDKLRFVSDSKKLSLILLNLLSNSIKYSPEGSKIRINFEIIEDYLNVTISDEGEGISESDLENIFDRFKRIDTTINSVTGGTGLGLSVVKALIEILNGNIKIVNEDGTKIFIAIPETQIGEDDESTEDDTIIFDEELF